jgi:hypothetical protein
LEPPLRSDWTLRPGPTFSKTGGVWYVTGSAHASGTP